MCSFSEEQTSLYQAVKTRFLDEINRYGLSDLNMAIFRLFSGLHAVSCGVLPSGFLGVRRLRNRRIDTLFNELRQFRTSHVIIWANYLESIAALNEALPTAFPQIPVYTLHGRVPATERAAKIDLWKKEAAYLWRRRGPEGTG